MAPRTQKSTANQPAPMVGNLVIARPGMYQQSDFSSGPYLLHILMIRGLQCLLGEAAFA